MDFRDLLHKVMGQESLSVNEAREAMLLMLEGNASTPLITAFLTALRMKGETVDEMVGLAQAMREKSTRVDGGPAHRLVDTCGTGGDQSGTFNISTAAAFVVAGAGVCVAKHGNRSVSSRCGSADVLEALGVRVDLDGETAGRAIREVGIGFLCSPRLHLGMQFVGEARSELKTRTAFNLLGPLTNPAGAATRLIGASSPAAARLIAETLSRLGGCQALVAHGSDGLDEITTTGSTLVYHVWNGDVHECRWSPEDFGIATGVLGDLRGGDREVNARIVRRVLRGERGPARDIVVLNAAAALLLCGAAQTRPEAVRRAEASIDSGAAAGKLRELAAFMRI